MTLKELLLQELETADDALLADTLAWIRSRKDLNQSQQTSSTPARSLNGEPTLQGAKLGDLLQFANTWVGDDLEDCLEAVYATRSQAEVHPESDPFQ